MRHVDQLREKFPHVGAERERGLGRLMPFNAQALEEFLPGGSGGTGCEGRTDAGSVEIVPSAAMFSAQEELGGGKFCHAIIG